MRKKLRKILQWLLQEPQSNRKPELSDYYVNHYGDLYCVAIVEDKPTVTIISGTIELDGRVCFKSDEKDNELNRKIFIVFER